MSEEKSIPQEKPQSNENFIEKPLISGVPEFPREYIEKGINESKLPDFKLTPPPPPPPPSQSESDSKSE